MDPSLSAAERRNVYRSLKLLVKGLENCAVTVDLRNESCVTGVVRQVDAEMNITFSDAALFESGTDYKYFETLFLPARMIRNVIIPDNMPIKRTILSMLPSKNRNKPEPGKMTFKKKRALKNQMESLQLLRDAQKAKDSRASQSTISKAQ